MIPRRLAIPLALALTGCGGGQTMPMQGGALFTVPVPRNVRVHSDRGKSWMLPQKKKSPLLYVDDWSTNDVDVYDYSSGQPVGTLTGFDEPYGMCVDAKGDVYIANYGNGTVYEYAHGGTKTVNVYAPGGEPMGCSISGSGDVAITSFSPGDVTVYPKGKTTGSTTYSDGSCEYQWTMGYDAKGDLVGEGEATRIDVCALLAGSKAETTLSERGITIDFPGGTSWDGKYIALGDQEAGGTYETGAWRATISGSTITAVGNEIKFGGGCYSNYAEVINPFFAGKQNITPKGTRAAKWMVGANLWCDSKGYSSVYVWPYPAGGNPIRRFSNSPSEPYGSAVSIAQ